MYGLDFPGSVFLTIGDADTLWHPQFSVPKSLHLQRRELSYLPSAGRVPFVLLRLSYPSSTIFTCNTGFGFMWFGRKLVVHFCVVCTDIF